MNNSQGFSPYQYHISKLSSLPMSAVTLILIVIWALSMIMVPIVKWTLGADAIYPLISFSVIIQAAAVASILYFAWGGRLTLKVAGIVFLFTLGAEILGSSTGFPFGAYAYTDKLQPQLGHVPLLVPMAWFMMLPSAWAIAQHYRQKMWLFVLISALSLTAWDLLLDPQMVHWDLWQWERNGLYFGIPLTNFVGWLLVAALLTALIRPKTVPAIPLLIVYSITWFLEVFGLAFFWGMPGPALIGGLVMGFFMWLGWRAVLTNKTGES